jgi:hypothetical protein
VGLATCIGQPVDVPIIVRSLAESMATLNEDELPIGLEMDFHKALDSGIINQNEMCQMVEKYECCWWKGKKPTNLDSTKILNSSSVDICLGTHFIELGTNPPSKNPERKVKASSTKIRDHCQKCDAYIEILSNSLQDILQLN